MFQSEEVVTRQSEAEALSLWLSSLIEDKTVRINEKTIQLMNDETVERLNNITNEGVNENINNLKIKC